MSAVPVIHMYADVRVVADKTVLLVVQMHACMRARLAGREGMPLQAA